MQRRKFCANTLLRHIQPPRVSKAGSLGHFDKWRIPEPCSGELDKSKVTLSRLIVPCSAAACVFQLVEASGGEVSQGIDVAKDRFLALVVFPRRDDRGSAARLDIVPNCVWILSLVRK